MTLDPTLLHALAQYRAAVAQQRGAAPAMRAYWDAEVARCFDQVDRVRNRPVLQRAPSNAAPVKPPPASDTILDAGDDDAPDAAPIWQAADARTRVRQHRISVVLGGLILLMMVGWLGQCVWSYAYDGWGKIHLATVIIVGIIGRTLYRERRAKSK